LFAIQTNESMLNKWKDIRVTTENLPELTQTPAEVMTLWKCIWQGSREKNRILGK